MKMFKASLLLASAIVIGACSDSPTATPVSDSNAAATDDATAVNPDPTTTSSSTPGTIPTTTTIVTTTTAASSSSSSTTPVLASTTCTANELPPSGSAFAPVMVHDITADDSDKGLNIRTGPSTADAIQFALPNGSTMTATGPCEKDSTGRVWWEVENGMWSGWAAARYLTVFDATAATSCPVANYNPIGKGTVDKILGDFDGNGSVDAMYLAYDGVVNAPYAWTGSKATVQIQYADGGLSYELDITSILSDGGPTLGIIQMPDFPERIDPANTARSVAVLSSHYDTSATGAGQAHFVGELNCSPTVIANMAVTPSAGNPENPVLCDVGGGGRTQLYALEGFDANFNYLVTEYDFQGASFVPQGQQAVSSQGVALSVEQAVC